MGGAVPANSQDGRVFAKSLIYCPKNLLETSICGTDQIRLNRFTPAREDLPCYVERGIGVSRIGGAAARPGDSAQRRRKRVAQHREPVIDPLAGQTLLGAGALVSSPAPGAQVEVRAEQLEKALGDTLVNVENGRNAALNPSMALEAR